MMKLEATEGHSENTGESCSENHGVLWPLFSDCRGVKEHVVAVPICWPHFKALALWSLLFRIGQKSCCMSMTSPLGRS
eukprot:3513372-Amphidinium_carterae.1